jgi:hypothetical protein
MSPFRASAATFGRLKQGDIGVCGRASVKQSARGIGDFGYNLAKCGKNVGAGRKPAQQRIPRARFVRSATIIVIQGFIRISCGCPAGAPPAVSGYNNRIACGCDIATGLRSALPSPTSLR